MTNKTKWEYRIEACGYQNRMKIMTELGNEGWELVYHDPQVARVEMIFKRPLIDDKERFC